MDPAFPFGKTKPRKEHLVVDIGADLEFGPDFRGGDRKRGVVVGSIGVRSIEKKFDLVLWLCV